MRSCQSGFLLVQFLITLAVFMVLILCIKSGSSSAHRVLVKTEAEHIYTIALYLRRKAMTTGVEHSILFDPLSRSYFVEGTKHTLPKGVFFGVDPTVKGPPSCPVKRLSKPITFARSQITFYPSGIIQPGSVYLCDKKKESMYALSVSVTQVSLIRMYRYGTTWQLVA